MKLIINNSSMQPIYEQIVSQVKKEIMQGELQEGEMLPSVRTLAKELKVSALTVKKPTMPWMRKDLLLLYTEKAASSHWPTRN